MHNSGTTLIGFPRKGSLECQPNDVFMNLIIEFYKALEPHNSLIRPNRLINTNLFSLLTSFIACLNKIIFHRVSLRRPTYRIPITSATHNDPPAAEGALVGDNRTCPVTSKQVESLVSSLCPSCLPLSFRTGGTKSGFLGKPQPPLRLTFRRGAGHREEL